MAEGVTVYSAVPACTTLVDGFVANGFAHIKEGQADIRREIAAGECATIAAVKDAESSLQRDLSALTITMLNRFSDVDKQALKAEYEAKLTAQQVIKELSVVAQHNAERSQDKTEAFALRTQDKVAHGFEENEEKLDALSAQIGKGFFHAREEDLEQEVSELQQALTAQKIEKLICCGCGSDPKGK